MTDSPDANLCASKEWGRLAESPFSKCRGEMRELLISIKSCDRANRREDLIYSEGFVYKWKPPAITASFSHEVSGHGYSHYHSRKNIKQHSRLDAFMPLDCLFLEMFPLLPVAMVMEVFLVKMLMTTNKQENSLISASFIRSK